MVINGRLASNIFEMNNKGLTQRGVYLGSRKRKPP